jgi:hypothetical protein
MAKTENSEPQKQTPAAPAPEKKKEKKPRVKQIEVPPLVDLTINFSSKAFLLVSLLVALISLSAGCDLLTIFVRTMVTMIVSGLLMWLVSWWITQQYLADQQEQFKAKREEPADGLIKDVKA